MKIPVAIPHSRTPAVPAAAHEPETRRVVGGPGVPDVVTAYLEVANTCNSLCETCPLTFGIHEHAAFLSFSEVEGITAQLPGLRRAVLHGIGEPLLNPELPRMVQHLAVRGVTTCFNTNGLLLNRRRTGDLIEAGLDDLRVSLDAARPETYRRIRGVDGHRAVLRNIGRVAEMRRAAAAANPKLTVYFTTLRENVGELPEVLRLAHGLGADALVVQRMTFFDRGLATAEQSLFRRLEEDQRRILNEVERDAAKLGVELLGTAGVSPLQALEDAPPREGCRRPWESTYVTAQGTVFSCCIAPFTGVPFESIGLGNVFESSLFDIWHGTRYEEVRHGLRGGQVVPACEGCGERWSY